MQSKSLSVKLIVCYNAFNMNTATRRSEINKLEDKFYEIHDKLVDELKSGRKSVEKILWKLTKLRPHAVKKMYDKTIQKMLPDLEKNDTVNALFRRLNPLFTFIDYELLEHLISELGSQSLKYDMSSYVCGLILFKKEATVGDLIDYWPGDRIADEGDYFKRLMAKFEGDPNKYALEMLDNFRLNYFSALRLSEFISYFIFVCVKKAMSFYAVWRIPAVIVPDVIEAARHLDSSFYMKEGAVMVSLDGKLLYLYVEEHLSSAFQFPNVLKTMKMTSSAAQQLQQNWSVFDSQLQPFTSKLSTPIPRLRSSSLPSRRQSFVPLYLSRSSSLPEMLLPSDSTLQSTLPSLQHSSRGLQHGVDPKYKVDPMSTDNDGNTPVHAAALGGSKDVLSMLISKYGCPVDCRNNSQQTPLHLACSKGELGVVRMLVCEYKADLNVFDEDGNTPICVATYCGQTKIVKCLIDGFSCSSNTKGAGGKSLLHFACREGHIGLVEILLEVYNLHPSSVDNDGNTPLHDAALNGREEVVKLLITKYGCPVDCRNSNKQTPLHLACSKGNLGVVRMLVTGYKANLNAIDKDTNTPLHTAAWCGQLEIVNYLMKKSGACSERSIKRHDGKSILHIACFQGHTELAEALLTQHNQGLMTLDSAGNTPLHDAVQHGREEVVKVLITKYGCPVDCKNSNKQTPLHLACSKGNLGVVRMLVNEYKADLNALDKDSNTPICVATYCGHTKIVKCLIDEFSCSPISKGALGKSLLHFACKGGHTELAETLLTEYNLDPMSADDEGNTPLHDAAFGGVKSLIEVLITKYACPVDCRNNFTQTPLHLSCSRGHLNVVRMLVKAYNADLNICDKDGNPPLHVAAICGQTEVMSCLVKEFNCDPNTRGKDGQTILHLASQNGHLQLVDEIFTWFDLDPLSVDNNGNTTLHYAALGGKEQIADLLITKYGSIVNCKNIRNETPLHIACSKGYLGFIGILVTKHKADLNALDENNNTPLHTAALCGQAGVVYCLIEELHCDPYITGFKDRNILHHACCHDHEMLVRLLIDTFQLSLISADTDGNTPLHLAAMLGQNKCVQTLLDNDHAPIYLRNFSGKTALQVSRNAKTRAIINNYLKQENVSSKIQHYYKQLQILSNKKYSGAQRLTRVFVMGNNGSGKTTLIESLKIEGFFASFNIVNVYSAPPHTSGIIPSIYYSKNIGRLIFYDFAGDPEYYSSHSTTVSNVMQSQEGTNVCLILVNFVKDTEQILEELGYWLSFISNHGVNLKEEIKVLILGSHVDCVIGNEAGKMVESVSKLTQEYLSHTPKAKLKILNDCLTLNCRKPRSSRQVHKLLFPVIERANKCRLSTEAAVLLGLLEKDFKNVVTCSLQTLLDHIAGTGICLPTVAKSLYPIVKELHTVGLLMAIEGKSTEPENSLLLLNVAKLTNEIHELLFSEFSYQQLIQSTNIQSVSMGILPEQYLSSFLPEYISTECLVQLQYCQELSHAEVKFNSVVPTNDSSAPTLLYFPALCRKERKENIETPDCFNYNLSWYMKCIGKFDYLPPRFLHVLLLRLSYSFTLPAVAHRQSSETPEEHSSSAVQLYNYHCTMWKNGIHWLMEEGVECFVENVNNSKGIVIITKSKESQKYVCAEMLFKIIREIHETKDEFCGTVTLRQYLMDSIDPASFSNEDRLFALSEIHYTLKEGKRFVISATGQGLLDTTKIADITNFVQYGKPTEIMHI